MTDVVLIEGLTVNTVIGVYEWERAICQPVVIDVKLHYDLSAALDEDDLAHTINYKAVCEDIEQICHDTRAQLLEYLAGQIFKKLFESYPIDKIELRLTKPHAIKNAQNVGVSITRDRYARRT